MIVVAIIFFAIDVNSGKFKRLYERKTMIDINAFFEGIKVMDKIQAFRDPVDYHDLNLDEVYQVISRDPYLEHPFRLADNTTDSVHHRGPTVSAHYSRNVYAQKLLWGASLGY